MWDSNNFTKKITQKLEKILSSQIPSWHKNCPESHNLSSRILYIKKGYCNINTRKTYNKIWASNILKGKLLFRDNECVVHLCMNSAFINTNGSHIQASRKNTWCNRFSERGMAYDIFLSEYKGIPEIWE